MSHDKLVTVYGSFLRRENKRRKVRYWVLTGLCWVFGLAVWITLIWLFQIHVALGWMD